MDEFLSTLNKLYKCLSMIYLTINCLPFDMLNNEQVYYVMSDIPFLDYNLVVGYLIPEKNKKENRGIIKDLIININSNIKNNAIEMKNLIKREMIEDVKYRIKNLKREYTFIRYNLFSDLKNLEVYTTIEREIVSIFKQYFSFETKDHETINSLMQFVFGLFDEIEDLIGYHMKKENERLLKINEEKMKNLFSQFLELLMNIKQEYKIFDTLPTILELDYSEICIQIDSLIKLKNSILDEFIISKIQNNQETENIKKRCQQSFEKTSEITQALIIKTLEKQLMLTNKRGLLNNTLLINALSNYIDFYEFSLKQIFNHNVNSFPQKIEAYGLKIYEMESSPSPER